ncbi:Glutaredoxin family protein [Theileria parva strain Muguga]|uniref:1-Cys-glutaredoxin-like protein, putative n=1 Tax=Theileria parva TaxID=5875 RepID=Q4N311_THEPA|nr:uncharacterized protein TpMuguga_04g00177 [Theileria parva strain Muguga]EAN31528.1 Glutaredoxin family protein [Theileria parva strain Muguga]|eukprot:XP_763811.1 hypothetical protein [Theileria parva strain Muguga]
MRLIRTNFRFLRFLSNFKIPSYTSISNSYTIHNYIHQGSLRSKRFFSTETEVNLEKEIEEKLKKTIETEKILIFIKGTPEDPQCKYSAKLIEILNNYKLNDYAYINVFSHELLRKCVKNISNWPTFPQLYVNGKLVGGCDIVSELHTNGQLQNLFHSNS